MTMQKLPNPEERLRYNTLCSAAISRHVGFKVELELDIFPLSEHVTKSRVFGANIHPIGKTCSTVQVPSRVVVKEYLPGVRGTTDQSDRTKFEYMRERAMLALGVTIGGNERVFPKSYSTELQSGMVIVREYIDGESIERLSKREGEALMWSPQIGGTSITDPLYAIALLHAKSPVIAAELSQKGLLEYGLPEKVNPKQLAHVRAGHLMIYLNTLIRASGRTAIKKGTLERELTHALEELDRKFISRADSLTTVNGDLDTFAHHTIGNVLPDAGSVTTGGLVRDLAVYTAPCCARLWRNTDDTLKKIASDYSRIRAGYDDRLYYPAQKWDLDLMGRGILLAGAFGNLRKAAAVVHYNGRDRDYPVDAEKKAYLDNARNFLERFAARAGKASRKSANLIIDTMSDYHLIDEHYSPEPPPTSVRSGKQTRVSV